MLLQYNNRERDSCAFILLTLFSALTLASGSTERFNSLTVKDGLSQNSVYAMAEDRSGFMWFATADGLNRFDGYEFRVFRFQSSPSASDTPIKVNVLLVDLQGTLWAGTDGAGLNQYDSQTQRFVQYKHNPKNPASLSHNTVTRASYG
jgi:ligand-binding sensor domain-containing protein